MPACSSRADRCLAVIAGSILLASLMAWASPAPAQQPTHILPFRLPCWSIAEHRAAMAALGAEMIAGGIEDDGVDRTVVYALPRGAGATGWLVVQIRPARGVACNATAGATPWQSIETAPPPATPEREG